MIDLNQLDMTKLSADEQMIVADNLAYEMGGAAAVVKFANDMMNAGILHPSRAENLVDLLTPEHKALLGDLYGR